MVVYPIVHNSMFNRCTLEHRHRCNLFLGVIYFYRANIVSACIVLEKKTIFMLFNNIIHYRKYFVKLSTVEISEDI